MDLKCVHSIILCCYQSTVSSFVAAQELDEKHAQSLLFSKDFIKPCDWDCWHFCFVFHAMCFSRCREKQRKEASCLQTVNKKLNAMNKLLMEENDRLQKQVSHLVYGNGYMKQKLHTASSATTTDTSCESVAISGQNQQKALAPQHPTSDANSPAGLLSIAEETLAEFLSKATGTAVDWVQLIGMKPVLDSIGIVVLSHSVIGVTARACTLVSLEPTKIVEILKDRPSWYRDCRCVEIASLVPTGNGGTIELIYMQDCISYLSSWLRIVNNVISCSSHPLMTYAPTTLASARDF